MTEVWKPVVGFEDNYEVSSLGNFRKATTKRQVRAYVSPQNGYAYVRLSLNGVAKNYRAHRIVLTAHVGPALEGQQARHLNGRRSDNCVTNLAWGTPKENYSDKQRHGTAYSHYAVNTGEKHPNAKVSDSDVAKIRALAKRGWFQKDIAAIFGITQSNVSRILSGESRK